MQGVGHMPMGDTHSSLPGVQEGILQHLEVLEDQGGQVGQVVAQRGQEDRVDQEGHQLGLHTGQGNLQEIQGSSLEVLEVLEVRRDQDIGQEHSWYEIPRLTPRFQRV